MEICHRPYNNRLMAKTPKRPRDPNQLAKLIVDISTGEEENIKPAEKVSAAVALGKRGGTARAKSLTSKERKAIAVRAAKKRWDK
jgi:hypothetical protein